MAFMAEILGRDYWQFDEQRNTFSAGMEVSISLGGIKEP